MQKGWNRLPQDLGELLVKLPINRDFAAAEIDRRGHRWAGTIQALKCRGLIESRGWKNQHEKVKVWRVTEQGAKLAAVLRGREVVGLTYFLTLKMDGTFPGAPERDTVVLTSEQYDELYDKFVAPDRKAKGWD